MLSTPLSLDVQLTPGDIYRVAVRTMLRKLWFVVVVPIFVLLGSALLLLADPAFWPKVKDNFQPMFIMAAILAFLIFGIPYFSARSTFSTQKALQRPIRYTFSAEGIEMESVISSSRMDWAAVIRAAETNAYFLLYPSKTIMWIIPKRAISDQSAMNELREILRTCVKGKVKLSK